MDAMLESEDFVLATQCQPTECLHCVAIAAYEVLFAPNFLTYPRIFPHARDIGPVTPSGVPGTPPAPDRISVRLFNHPASRTPLPSLRAHLIDQLVTLTATVIRAGPVKARVVGLDFLCQKCGASQFKPFVHTDYKYAPPSICGVDGCRARTFTPHRESAVCADAQILTVQDMLTGLESIETNTNHNTTKHKLLTSTTSTVTAAAATGGAGGTAAASGQGVPRSIEVDLMDDLAGRSRPGDVITLVGILRVRRNPASASGGGGGGSGGGGGRGGGRFGGGGRGGPSARTITTPESGVFGFYVEGVHLSVTGALTNTDSDGGGGSEQGPGRGSGAGPGLATVPGMPLLRIPDLDFIRTYFEVCRGRYLRQLVRSFCPHIFGQRVVKAGLLLALFSGVHKEATVHSATDDHHDDDDDDHHDPSVRGENPQGKQGRTTTTSTIRSGGDPQDDDDDDAGSGSDRAEIDAPEASATVPLRGNIHVLLVGDPGLGKSQLLQAAGRVAPRSVYVCGNSSTSVGLTVAVTRDGGGEYSFEAGAVVQADRGVVCVDEFDKMAKEHAALLEVMEQQAVSVAKAGLVASLPARTTILAAANPRQGHYDRRRSVAKNLNANPALLSRFDLIFVMEDRAEFEQDARLSEHVLAMHSGDPHRVARMQQDLEGDDPFDDRALSYDDEQHGHDHYPGHGSLRLDHVDHRTRRTMVETTTDDERRNRRRLDHDDDGSTRGRRRRRQPVYPSLPAPDPPSSGPSSSHPPFVPCPSRRPLEDRLRPHPGDDDVEPIPIELMRRLVAYAQTFVHPVLSNDACRILQDFWLACRQGARASGGGGGGGGPPYESGSVDSLPVTLRQLDGLVRLAEARARMDLSEVVTLEHAWDVVDLMSRTALVAGRLATGAPDGGDPQAMLAAPPAPKRRRGGRAAEAERLLDALATRQRGMGGAPVEVAEIYDLADRMQIQGDVRLLLELLNDAGQLLKNGPATFRVPSSRR